MKSETFRCPHCKTELKKSAADFIHGEQGEAGNFIALGGTDTETCPACGGTIDRMSLIQGRYDPKACFIATAVYGNPDCHQVIELRKWRDRSLSSTISGRVFIYLYNMGGPIAASLLSRSPRMLGVARFLLDHLLQLLRKQ